MRATAIKTGTVVRLRTGREVRIDDGPKAIELCQQEIFRCGQRYEDIARRAGVCQGTVSRLARGDTTKPHLATVARVLMAIGWRLIARED